MAATSADPIPILPPAANGQSPPQTTVPHPPITPFPAPPRSVTTAPDWSVWDSADTGVQSGSRYDDESTALYFTDRPVRTVTLPATVWAGMTLLGALGVGQLVRRRRVRAEPVKRRDAV